MAIKFREKRIAREAEAKGKAEGKAIGRAECQMEVATRMIKTAEFPLEQISQICGLTLPQLNKLKAELQ